MLQPCEKDDKAHVPLIYPEMHTDADDEKWAPKRLRVATSFLFYMICALLLLWVAYFAVACVLLVRSNVQPVQDACKGFWEYMVVSITSPALVPLAYVLIGMGVVAWRDFYIVSSLALAIAGLYMTLQASGNEQCVKALRDTSPPEPWLLILSWIKVVAYISVSTSGLISRFR